MNRLLVSGLPICAFPISQAERAGPLGQRPEDGRPEGRNPAQQGFGSRQSYPDRGQAETECSIELVLGCREIAERLPE